MKLNYEKIHRVYENIPWYLKNDAFGLGQSFFLRKYNERFNEELELIYKMKFPKKKKIDLTLLGDEIINPVKEKYQKIVIETYKAKLNHIVKLRKLLDDLAPTVEIAPTKEMNLIKSSSASTYSSQTQANKYAKDVIIEDYNLLNKLGYCVEIKEHSTYEGSNWKNYELWGNLKDWQFDCILRRDKTTLLEWAKNCWRRGTNPKVLNPFLNDEIYYKSMEEYKND